MCSTPGDDVSEIYAQQRFAWKVAMKIRTGKPFFSGATGTVPREIQNLANHLLNANKTTKALRAAKPYLTCVGEDLHGNDYTCGSCTTAHGKLYCYSCEVAENDKMLQDIRKTPCSGLLCPAKKGGLCKVQYYQNMESDENGDYHIKQICPCEDAQCCSDTCTRCDSIKESLSELKSISELRKSQKPCTCPKCPAKHKGLCQIEYFENGDKKCKCTRCDKQYPMCCYVKKPPIDDDSDYDEFDVQVCENCVSSEGNVIHKLCRCCGDIGKTKEHE